MSKSYIGGCACGAIHYDIPAEPLVMNDCQCRQCQRDSGTGHGSYLTFPRAAVTVRGQANTWDLVGDNGYVKSRGFCANCGTLVYLTLPAVPDIFVVYAGSLEDPSRYRPQFVCWTAAGHQWDHMDPDLPRFEKMPPA